MVYRTHGQTGTRKYRAWLSAITRCENQNQPYWPDWGGRGITMCDRWRHGEGGKSGFECFDADMPPHPGPGFTLERIKNDLGYMPGNCRWATGIEQANNRRNGRRVTAFGHTLTIAEWSRVTGINYFTIRSRLRLGWEGDRVLDPDDGRSGGVS